MPIEWRGRCAVCGHVASLGGCRKPVPCAKCRVEFSAAELEMWASGIDPRPTLFDRIAGAVRKWWGAKP